MLEYIKNILPRIQNYSERVNRKEQLVEKTWVWVGFAEEYSTFHFLRDQRILISKMGNVQEGKWEFIGNELLHISGDGFNILLNHGILFEGVLIIQKQGILDHFEILYDKVVIPDGDIIKYIERKLPPEPPTITVPVSDYPFNLIVDGLTLVFTNKPEIGMLIKSEKIYSGKVSGLPNNIGVDITENRINRVYYYATITTNSGVIVLEIDNCDWAQPKGRGYFVDEKTVPDDLYKILSSIPIVKWKSIKFIRGKIDFVGYLSDGEYMVILGMGLIVILLIVLGIIIN